MALNQHVLPDILFPGLRLVLCGTQAGRVSALRGAYYAGPGNKFWKTLHDIGLTPELLGPTDFLSLPAHGIGLTDVAKATFGPDAALLRSHFDVESFMSKIRAHAPAVVAFNGKRAAQAALSLPSGVISYGLQAAKLAGALAFVLPSTSGAAARFWSIEPWHELSTLVNALEPSA